MKKYQQLLLAILSIFSFSCLLIYRHEYNKLRYVLEVLNFFGTPGVSTAVPPGCRLNGTMGRLTISEYPPPSWQRVSNSLYIYSAYWEKVEDKEYVKAFAIGVLNENLNYGCYIWYNSNPRTKTGQFSFSGIAYKPQDSISNKNFGKSRTKAFVFYCEAEAKGVIPVGVTFYKTSVNETSQGFLPVTSLPNTEPPKNSSVACILPSPFPNYNRSTLLDFLAFHKVIGINDFVIYGSNDQHNLLSFIQRDISNKIEITVLQWNYPFFNDYELMKVVAENDCKTRMTGLFENVLVLNWNKFVVPKYSKSINKILNELDYAKNTFKFHITNLLFCLEYENDIHSNSSAMILFQKTRYSFPKFDMLVPIYRPYLRSGKIQKVSKDIIAVHQYTSCRDIKIKSGDKKSDKVDTSVFKYQNKLLKSKLLSI